jgi:hypothetical protein
MSALGADEWRAAFTAAVADVGDGMTYEQAAERLRAVIRTGLLYGPFQQSITLPFRSAPQRSTVPAINHVALQFRSATVDS